MDCRRHLLGARLRAARSTARPSAAVRSCAHGLLLTALLLVSAAPAHAATAPVLQAPDDASAASVGGSLTFRWQGALQGDTDTLDRSFFRLEIAEPANVPGDQQAPWPVLETFAHTDPGVAATSITVGVPAAGDYRWRVCAWGVIDRFLVNEVAQLEDGCSRSRTFSAKAATGTSHTIGELTQKNRVVVRRAPRVVEQTRTAPSTPAPQPVQPAPQPVIVPEEAEPAAFQRVEPRDVGDAGSALGLDRSGFEGGEGRTGTAGTVLDGLGTTLPFVPIPFWTLALLLASLPIAVAWRRSVLAMFEWSDGSVDGQGTPFEQPDELPEDPRAVRPAEAAAAPHEIEAEPAGRRRAA